MIRLALTDDEAVAVHHALSTTVTLMDHVQEHGEGIPPDAPLYGQRDCLILIAKRLDHEQHHHGRVPNPNGP